MSNTLTVEELNAFYGESQVLFDVSIELGEGEVVGVFGRNGMGKTTLLESIVNRIDRKTGTVRFRDTDISEWDPHEIVREGICYVPADRETYPALSVRENLELSAPRGLSDEAVEDRLSSVFDKFERLGERESQRAGTLSGGEQQMLAMGRALVRDPDVLLLDEPTEGLAPFIVEDVLDALNEMAAEDRTILVVEQNITKSLPLIERGYILETGEVVAEGDSAYLSDETLHEEYLTV